MVGGIAVPMRMPIGGSIEFASGRLPSVAPRHRQKGRPKSLSVDTQERRMRITFRAEEREGALVWKGKCIIPRT